MTTITQGDFIVEVGGFTGRGSSYEDAVADCLNQFRQSPELTSIDNSSIELPGGLRLDYRDFESMPKEIPDGLVLVIVTLYSKYSGDRVSDCHYLAMKPGKYELWGGDNELEVIEYPVSLCFPDYFQREVRPVPPDTMEWYEGKWVSCGSHTITKI